MPARATSARAISARATSARATWARATSARATSARATWARATSAAVATPSPSRSARATWARATSAAAISTSAPAWRPNATLPLNRLPDGDGRHRRGSVAAERSRGLSHQRRLRRHRRRHAGRGVVAVPELREPDRLLDLPDPICGRPLRAAGSAADAANRHRLERVGAAADLGPWTTPRPLARFWPTT